MLRGESQVMPKSLMACCGLKTDSVGKSDESCDAVHASVRPPWDWMMVMGREVGMELKSPVCKGMLALSMKGLPRRGQTHCDDVPTTSGRSSDEISELPGPDKSMSPVPFVPFIATTRIHLSQRLLAKSKACRRAVPDTHVRVEHFDVTQKFVLQ